MQKFGIDTSRWQGDFDFAKAKKDEGVEFAILKIGGADGGLYKDRQFDNSYKNCVACGLDKGAYFFGHAMSMDEAKKEAEYIISLLKDHQFEYPIFYDVEADMLSVDKVTLTNIIKYVLSTVEAAGYWVGLYGSSYHLEKAVNDVDLKTYSHWAASWQKTKPSFEHSEVQMWQFGGETNAIRSNKINGIVVDQNYCFVDYPTKIKAAHLNGFKAQASATVKPTPTVSTTASSVKAYTVKKDDTLSAIATAFKTTVEVLAKLNGIRDVNKIYVGQVIKLPVVKTIKEGSKVKVKAGAKFYNGVQPKSFVYTTVYDVISVTGDKVLIGIGKAITGAMKKSDLIIQ